MAKIPPFINAQLLQAALEEGLNFPRRTEGVQVQEFTAQCATSAGDNFLSDVFRVWVQFSRVGSTRNEDVSLIVKCMPDGGPRGSLIEQLDVFRKEIYMFRRVVPELSRLAGGEMFAARLFYATETPIRMLIFQDLKSLGYVMADRSTGGGLDINHCTVIMKKIAKFHAASMTMLYQADAGKMEELQSRFRYGHVNPSLKVEENVVLGILIAGLDTLIDCAEKYWTEMEPEVLQKLKTMRPRYADRVLECLYRKYTDGFRVLNHADLWSNNILFRYDSNKVPLDAVFVDYQLSFISSPGIDLNYSLMNCPTFEVREFQKDALLEVYYRQLVDSLKKLNYSSIPTVKDVQKEYKRMEYFGLVSAISILPIVTMDCVPDDLDVSFDALADERKAEQLRLFQYNGARYRKAITVVLERFHREGLLD
ncbi:uncharacterized protein LOC129740403 [Uranotaenia lowii]|uniref:uncharacterized protein LOC129740403 n=1 Tax=Uranotaenia lowii TaxID=190385 RepID=UPI002478B796|nr:uncharacterized protein LOC129740403 [Uranotaenia lowii]